MFVTKKIDMSFGICTLSVIPCRVAGNDRAEIVTQLLFGEHYTVIEEQEKWLKIRTAFDSYEAWICRKQFTEISSQNFDEHSINEFDSVGEYIGELSNTIIGNQNLPIGCTLPFLHQNKIKIKDISYLYRGLLATKSFKEIEKVALIYLNSPYLWGGKTPFGIDCSGFTQMVYKLCGLKLPRDAYQQAELGDTINFVANSKLGDLAFFDNEEGRITHVGIVLNDSKIIHASGKVRIDTLDHVGIYNSDLQKYSHKLRIIKNYESEL